MFYSTFLLTLLLLPSLRCTFLIRRQATSGGKRHQEASNEWCRVFHLSCLDGLITSSCLRASIECVRQSVLQNPVFGHLREVLIHLSESNQVDLPVLVLFDGCLFTCSRVVYTKQVARLFLFQPTNVTCSITITCLSNSSHYG